MGRLSRHVGQKNQPHHEIEASPQPVNAQKKGFDGLACSSNRQSQTLRGLSGEGPAAKWLGQERLRDASVCGVNHGSRDFAQSGSNHGHPAARNPSFSVVFSHLLQRCGCTAAYSRYLAWKLRCQTAPGHHGNYCRFVAPPTRHHVGGATGLESPDNASVSAA